MKNLLHKSIWMIILILFFGCTPEDPEFRIYDKTTGIFILNEGNFTYGNSSLSFLDLSTGEIENDVFFKANGFPLGDVGYSMHLHDSTGYICINNSAKIFVIHTGTFKHLGTISGLNSPRYFQMINLQKAYITDLYANVIWVVDPSSYSITDTIQTGRSTESLIIWEQFAIATCWSFGDEIIKIDIESNRMVDSLQITKQPNSLVIDKNNQLWVLSDGGYEGSYGGVEYPALTKINPSTFEVLEKFEFASLSASPLNLMINGAKDSLYFLYDSWISSQEFEPGIYRMAISDPALPAEPFIAEGNRHFYRMGLDPVTSDIYVSDAQDYLRDGYVFRFGGDGQIIDSLRAGRIPGHFAFRVEK